MMCIGHDLPFVLFVVWVISHSPCVSTLSALRSCTVSVRLDLVLDMCGVPCWLAGISSEVVCLSVVCARASSVSTCPLALSVPVRTVGFDFC